MAQLSSLFARRLALPVIALGLVTLSVSPAAAQSNPSHWVVTASYTPEWKIMDAIRDFLSEDGDPVNMQGSQFNIGMGRGSTRGGDWNIAFVRKPFTDGVLTSSTETDCFTPGPNQAQLCNTSTETLTNQGVFVQGVEANWFLSFVRIKDRVQAGLGVGVGIGTFNGDVHKVTTGTEYNFVTNPNGQGGSFRQSAINEQETVKISDELLPFLPLFNLGVEGSVIITPALKAKVAYGISFPGTGARVSVTYLIGAK